MEQGRQGLVGGFHVMIGRVGSRAIPDITGISGMIASSNMGSTASTAVLALAQLASGFVLAAIAGSLFGAGASSYQMAGAFDAVEEDLLQAFNLPVIGQYLGGGGSMVTPMARMALRGYSLSANVKSGSTLGPGNNNPATGNAIAYKLRGYSSRSMVRRSGFAAAPAGYSY
jgi:hypothetical protein